jgi:hypothetical protein
MLLYVDECSHSSFGLFVPGREPRYPLCGLQWDLDTFEKKKKYEFAGNTNLDLVIKQFVI